MNEGLRRLFIGRLDVERDMPPNAPETFCPVCHLAWKWVSHSECAALLGVVDPGPPWGWNDDA